MKRRNFSAVSIRGCADDNTLKSHNELVAISPKLTSAILSHYVHCCTLAMGGNRLFLLWNDFVFSPPACVTQYVSVLSTFFFFSLDMKCVPVCMNLLARASPTCLVKQDWCYRISSPSHRADVSFDLPPTTHTFFKPKSGGPTFSKHPPPLPQAPGVVLPTSTHLCLPHMWWHRLAPRLWLMAAVQPEEFPWVRASWLTPSRNSLLPVGWADGAGTGASDPVWGRQRGAPLHLLCI